LDIVSILLCPVHRATQSRGGNVEVVEVDDMVVVVVVVVVVETMVVVDAKVVVVVVVVVEVLVLGETSQQPSVVAHVSEGMHLSCPMQYRFSVGHGEGMAPPS